MTNDIINGSFELLGGLFLVLNCVTLCRDKQVKGVSVWPFVFYSLWGFWNLWYYPSLGQWFSFFGGIVVVSANAVWVLLHWYFSLKKRVRFGLSDAAWAAMLADHIKQHETIDK